MSEESVAPGGGLLVWGGRGCQDGAPSWSNNAFFSRFGPREKVFLISGLTSSFIPLRFGAESSITSSFPARADVKSFLVLRVFVSPAL